jgi:hypothetical protein
VSALPTRAQWEDACRGAAGEPGSWRRVAASPLWTVAPVPVSARAPVTVHGRAGDVSASVHEVGLRVRALEAVDMAALDADRFAGVDLILGRTVLLLDRHRLHARCDDPLVATVGRLDDDEVAGLPVSPRLWRATRWRSRHLLIVPGGEAAHDMWAPAGTMSLVAGDWALVHRTDVWDRVTAALLEAAASGTDPLAAAAEAPDREPNR